MKKYIKNNLGFIITMFIFITACAILTVLTVKNEPGYEKYNEYIKVVNLTEPPPVTNEKSDAEIALAENKVNLNTASSDELQTLPGIGASIAERIIVYREKYGDFVFIEELMQIEGIGEKKFADIKDYICIN